MLILFIISRFRLLNSLIFSFKSFQKFTITAPLQIHCFRSCLYQLMAIIFGVAPSFLPKACIMVHNTTPTVFSCIPTCKFH